MKKNRRGGLSVGRSSWKGQSTGMHGRWRLRKNAEKLRALARRKYHREIIAGARSATNRLQ
jgi:hypothetical protein